MRLLDYVFAARPLLHVPLWSVYLVSLRYHLQLSGERFGLSDFRLLLAMSLIAAGAFYFNQVHDAESDRINAKVGFLQNDILSERSLTRAYLIASVFAIAIGLTLSWLTVCILMFAFVLGYLYSAPPFRLKDRPIAGLLVNAAGAGFLPSVAVMPDLTMNNIGLMGWDNPFYFAAAVGGVYLLTTVPDLAGDAATGKKTVPVLFGSKAAVGAAAVILAYSGFIALRSERHLLLVVSSLAFLMAVIAFFSSSSKIVLFAAKIPILMLTCLAGYFFPLYLVFMIALIAGTRLYYRRRFGTVYPRLA
ncbi:MAG: UbiA family prenyltransferase [Candidatus Zixiibacteriota bacterium]